MVFQRRTWIMHPILYPIRHLWVISGGTRHKHLSTIFFFFLLSQQQRWERDPNWTRQLCLEKETIYQKQGVIYAYYNSATVVSSAIGLFCNCSQRSIKAKKTDVQCSEATTINASTAGGTIRHSWVFASSTLFREGRPAWTNMGH